MSLLLSLFVPLLLLRLRLPTCEAAVTDTGITATTGRCSSGDSDSSSEDSSAPGCWFGRGSGRRRRRQMSATEADIVAAVCSAGDREVVLPDRTRVDCLTASTAWEVDFSDKWAECVGQALHYAAAVGVGRRSGCLLVCRAATKPRTCRAHLARVRDTVAFHRLDMDVRMIREQEAKLAAPLA